jgi:hypothetical protein
MLGRLLIACYILVVSSAMAQQKDTIRENVNYRYKVLDNSTIQKDKVITKPSDPSLSGSKKNSGDTIREKIDYRIQSTANSNSYNNRVWNHYVALQTNSWFQKVLDSDSERVSLKNPVDFTYSFNNIKSGYGLGFGFGYSEQSAESKNTANNEVGTVTSHMTFRLSIDKKSNVWQRFIFSVGLDVLFSTSKDIKKTFMSGLVDEVYVRANGWGIGPRAALHCRVYKWIYIGTEASLYFKMLKSVSRTQFTGLPPENKLKSDEYTFNVVAPLALFLSVKI